VHEHNTNKWSQFDPTGVPQVTAVDWHADGKYYGGQVVDVDVETREIGIEYEDGETDNYGLNELSRDRVPLLLDFKKRSPAYQPIIEKVCSKHNRCAECKIAATRWPKFQMCTRCTSAKKNGFHTCKVVERHDNSVTGSENVHERAARAGHVGNSHDQTLPTGQQRQFVELTKATSGEAE